MYQALPALPYCKRRKAGRGTGNEAKELPSGSNGGTREPGQQLTSEIGLFFLVMWSQVAAPAVDPLFRRKRKGKTSFSNSAVTTCIMWHYHLHHVTLPLASCDITTWIMWCHHLHHVTQSTFQLWATYCRSEPNLLQKCPFLCCKSSDFYPACACAKRG